MKKAKVINESGYFSKENIERYKERRKLREAEKDNIAEEERLLEESKWEKKTKTPPNTLKQYKSRG